MLEIFHLSASIIAFLKMIFQKFIGCKYGLTVSNGTAALETALFGIGIKENDEIIIPNFTIISCLNAVLKFKATPVFVDIDKRTWNLDTELFERIVSKEDKSCNCLSFVWSSS